MTILVWLILGLVASAASSILIAALYRYATTGKVAEDFPRSERAPETPEEQRMGNTNNPYLEAAARAGEKLTAAQRSKIRRLAAPKEVDESEEGGRAG